MAGTVTVTDSAAQGYDARRRPVRRVVLDWASDASGAVSGNPAGPVSGELLRVTFVPDSGATQPSSLYDVTLLDAAGIDVLAGQGANLSNTAAGHVCPGTPMKDGTTTGTTYVALDDVLELRVANAGDSKGGLVVLHVR